MEWKMEKTENTIEVGKLEMTITPTVAEAMREIFEIEMLQGFKETLPDGRTRYEFNVPAEKAEILKEALLRVMTPELQSKN